MNKDEKTKIMPEGQTKFKKAARPAGTQTTSREKPANLTTSAPVANPTGVKNRENSIIAATPATLQKQETTTNPARTKKPQSTASSENRKSSQIPEPQKTPPRPPMPGTLTAEEKWERADLTDSFIFYKVMTENPDACRRLLERLLHVSIEKIEILGEKSLGIDSESKGIRLDVYVKDEERVFDVEMQVKNTGELPERARYYQGVMDVDMLKSGEPYRALKETHIIFICLKDLFGQGLSHYTFENLCIEKPCIKLNDRSHKHFFAAENYDKIESDRELKAFLKMLVTGKTEDTYTQELEAYTVETKQSVQVRRQYMDWARELNYEKERGYSIGYDSGYDSGYGTGYDSGLHQKAQEAAANFLKENVSPEVIARCTGLSLTEVEEIKNSLVCPE